MRRPLGQIGVQEPVAFGRPFGERERRRWRVHVAPAGRLGHHHLLHPVDDLRVAGDQIVRCEDAVVEEVLVHPIGERQLVLGIVLEIGVRLADVVVHGLVKL